MKVQGLLYAAAILLLALAAIGVTSKRVSLVLLAAALPDLAALVS